MTVYFSPQLPRIGTINQFRKKRIEDSAEKPGADKCMMLFLIEKRRIFATGNKIGVGEEAWRYKRRRDEALKLMSFDYAFNLLFILFEILLIKIYQDEM